MKATTIMALALGLLIAMIPAALAWQSGTPVNKLPPYGRPVLGKVIKGGHPQYWNARADIEYRQSFYGTKYGGESLRRRISRGPVRAPGSFMSKVQNRNAMDMGSSSVKTVASMEGKVGESSATMSGEATATN